MNRLFVKLFTKSREGAVLGALLLRSMINNSKVKYFNNQNNQRELLIVFIYDCELCKKEEDDPQEAITFFHPTWATSEQRHALCSQLMGVTQFSSGLFSIPKIIALQSGKFALKRLGRYVMCVGSDRNIPDVVLETRSNILYRLIRLFHESIEALNESLADECLSDKLSELFQVYLPILQYATNTFGNIPILKIPKSSSTLFLEAMHTLQGFQEIHGVLGGTLLYQNKVVASQLDTTLTKEFVVTDPYRIKLPAETVTTTFHLPLGVQLLKVYIASSEIERLKAENGDLYKALKELKNWRKELEAQGTNKNSCVKLPDSSVSICGMKRDVSRIFTVLEEEGGDAKDMTDVPDVVRDAVKARHLARIESVVPMSFVVPQSNVKVRRAHTPDNVPSTSKITMRYYSLGLPQMNSEWCDTPPEKLKSPRPYYNTICDPKYPLFREDGLPVSHALSESFLIGQIEDIKAEKNKPKTSIKTKSRPQSIPLKTNVTEKPKSLDLKLKQQKAKRSFSLPLNSSAGPMTHGVPLTPLMAKLSLLAEEGNTIETPMKTPSIGLKNLREVSRIQCNGNKDQEQINGTNNFGANLNSCNKNKCDDELIPAVLYVFGINKTSVLLLIDPAIAIQPEVVHSLWERSMSSLKHIEERLDTCLNATESNGNTDYSYAVVDPSWGPIERGGAYHPHQLELLTILHHTLHCNHLITDILVRSEDTLTYGYQCGETQVFYQENCIGPPGLPTPSDLMGLIPLKAKRVLERDQGIILL